MIGLGPLPNAPANLQRSDDGNSATSIGLEWDKMLSETLEVTSYKLYMDDGNGVSFDVVFEGTCSNAVVSNLTAGVQYSFYITAVNHNGEGTPSSAV